MFTAQKKRKENIAEYILYIWQLEDLLRALQFSPEAVYSQLVQPYRIDGNDRQTLLMWYMEITNLLREEGKEELGHLEHTLHLIGSLQELSDQLLAVPAGAKYRELYEEIAPEIPLLRSKLEKKDISDIELFFRALYSVVLLRIKGNADNDNPYIRNVILLISPLIAELSTIFHRIERGEIDIVAEPKK